jgi:hypothetical protein
LIVVLRMIVLLVVFELRDLMMRLSMIDVVAVVI